MVGIPSQEILPIRQNMIGTIHYPLRCISRGIFWRRCLRTQYDKWSFLLAEAKSFGKPVPIATCQGFGNNTTRPYRTPTLNELRYQAFSAVVQGIDKVLFWMYNGWGEKDPNAVNNVKNVVAQIQSIGAEMNAGTTFDPDITVNEGFDNLAYRYGTNGTSGVILAVNIANRSIGGKNIIAEFTLPDGINVTSIEVLHENRTIPVSQGKFTDLFNPFAVHRIY